MREACQDFCAGTAQVERAMETLAPALSKTLQGTCRKSERRNELLF